MSWNRRCLFNLNICFVNRNICVFTVYVNALLFFLNVYLHDDSGIPLRIKLAYRREFFGLILFLRHQRVQELLFTCVGNSIYLYLLGWLISAVLVVVGLERWWYVRCEVHLMIVFLKRHKAQAFSKAGAAEESRHS